MKITRKLLAGILSAAMIVSLASCSSPASSSQGESSAAGDSSAAQSSGEGQTGGSTEFWNDKLMNTNNSVLEEFSAAMKDNSGVDVEIVSYPDEAAYTTAVQQSIKEASAPGMFTWWSGEKLETLVKNGLVEDLTDLWDSDFVSAGVPEGIKDAFTVDGKVYAAPYSILYNPFFYNINCFEEAGVEVPTTFDEFLDVCAKLKEKGITPIGLKDDSWASFIWFQQIVAAYDPQDYLDVCDGTIKYTDEGIVNAMETWKMMIDNGYFADAITWTDMYKSFATGDVAMMIEPNIVLPYLTDDYGAVSGEDFSTFVMPSANGGKGVIFYEASPLCVASNSDDKEAAKTAVKNFFAESTQQVMCDGIGIANTSKVNVEDPTLKQIVDFSGDTDNVQLLLRYNENTPSELRDLAVDEFSKMMFAGASVEDTVNNIQAKADEVFGN